MNRSAARALTVSTIDALDLFDHVLGYEPDSFLDLDEPRQAVACVYAKSLEVVNQALRLYDTPCELWVQVYLERTAGSEAAIEAQLDALIPAAMSALWALDDVLAIDGSSAGYTTRPRDKLAYRVERFAVRFDDPRGS